jgi:hypothetical protein
MRGVVAGLGGVEVGPDGAGPEGTGGVEPALVDEFLLVRE